MSGPPDYVGIGSMAVGPNWWHGWLLAHPGVESRAAEDRSLHFFNQFCTRAMTEDDVAAYHASFPRSAGRIAGEWTPRYAVDVWTPLLLRRAAPDAKLLMMVSDPFERFRKRIATVRREGRRAEEYVMSEVVADGRYAAQLENVLAHFPREQVLVQQTERCAADPVAEYRRLTAFLGLDDHVPSKLHKNPEGGPLRRLLGRGRRRFGNLAQVDLLPRVAEALRQELQPDARRLAELVPDLDLSLWRQLFPAAERP